MRFRLYREHGALNSPDVFNAVERGLKQAGHTTTVSGEDIPVIWSVLWQGRMQPNKAVYDDAIRNSKKVLIIEVGNLARGKTWRISLNHVHRLGIFGNDMDLDFDRPKKLGITLSPPKAERDKEILIAAQHQQSLQWQGMPAMSAYIDKTVKEIRKHSERPIIIRPHPRSPFAINIKGVTVQTPVKLPNTYDDFNFNPSFHCVINHNAGAAVRAAILGVPVICHQENLAYPVSNKLENIENLEMIDRDRWFVELCHTEYTVEEITNGLPFKRLEKYF